MRPWTCGDGGGTVGCRQGRRRSWKSNVPRTGLPKIGTHPQLTAFVLVVACNPKGEELHKGTASPYAFGNFS